MCPLLIDGALSESWSLGAAFVPIILLDDWKTSAEHSVDESRREATVTITASVDERLSRKIKPQSQSSCRQERKGVESRCSCLPIAALIVMHTAEEEESHK